MLTSISFSLLNPQTAQPISQPPIPTDPHRNPTRSLNPETRKPKASSKLKLWSRARSIRSGRKLDRVKKPSQVANFSESVLISEPEAEAETDMDTDTDMLIGDEEGGKGIYMVSDGTGWTAEHSVSAALGQFGHCLVDRGCPVNTHLFSGIDEIERLMDIVKQAAKEGAMLVYTLADPSMAEAANKACKLWNVQSIDVLSPITEAISSHLGVSPSGLPRGAQTTLTEEYFQRIEAIEFTIKQDDGALPINLHKADIVLTGVSRTGKTPLSIYLAQKGYKVANVPIVMGITLPKTLFEIDPDKVFALTINPVVLQSIRRSRAKSLGLAADERTSYSEMDYVRGELEYAGKIFAQNPRWRVIEVTSKAIEETAAVILRLFHDRKQKCSMPRISKRY